MFYTIYKITNLIDGKIYIGKHQTKNLNDGYMGSGKHLKSAQNKYGIENFKKEILFQFDSEADMNAKEAELVTEEFCLREDTYNLCPGGKGGWGYVNQSSLNTLGTSIGGKTGRKVQIEKFITDETYRNKHRSNLSSSLRKRWERRDNVSVPYTLGYKHTEETLKIISAKNSGSKNSQFGTMWITNGQENKKIKKDVDIIPEGWYKGRT